MSNSSTLRRIEDAETTASRADDVLVELRDALRRAWSAADRGNAASYEQARHEVGARAAELEGLARKLTVAQSAGLPEKLAESVEAAPVVESAGGVARKLARGTPHRR
jgi:hypothetical protein